jgi:short-subunit dehydrogenase
MTASPQRTCLVTGAGRGIGAGIAHHLSAQDFPVAITARSRDQLNDLAAELPGPRLVIPAEITTTAAVEDIFATVEQEFGPVEILVANAGVASSH